MKTILVILFLAVAASAQPTAEERAYRERKSQRPTNEIAYPVMSYAVPRPPKVAPKVEQHLTDAEVLALAVTNRPAVFIPVHVEPEILAQAKVKWRKQHPLLPANAVGKTAPNDWRLK